MSIYQWLCVAGIPSVITLIITRVITKRLTKAEKAADEARIKSDAIALGIQALLRDRLLTGYKGYIAQGWADYNDRSNLENVYKQYKALEGNGDMKDLRRTFRHLPQTAGGPPTEVSSEEE